MKKSKKIFLIISIVILTIISLITSYSLGHYVGKSDVVIKDPVYVENVKNAPRSTYSNFVDYDPLVTNVPGLSYSTTSYADKVSYYEVYTNENNDTLDITICIGNSFGGTYYESETNNLIYNSSINIFVVVHSYNSNEAMDVYYYDRIYVQRHEFTFYNSGSRPILNQQSFIIDSLGINGEQDGYDYGLVFRFLTFDNYYNSDTGLWEREFNTEYGINMIIEEPLFFNTIYNIYTNSMFSNSHNSTEFSYSAGYDNGYFMGNENAVENGFLGGIFSLFISASDTFINVMSVPIFPGITLGTLILFPLVILLLSLIIKIFFGG